MAERKSVLLRLDPAVHDALARWAGDELRSTNAQIEFLLRRALAEAGRMPNEARGIAKRGRPPKTGSPAANGSTEGSGDDVGSGVSTAGSGSEGEPEPA